MEALLSLPNPFRNTIVRTPWQPAEADVPEVNGDVFEFCLKQLAEVRERQHSGAILVLGESGSGKTHLLARLRMRIEEDRNDASRAAGSEAVFISVRLQTSGPRLCRHIRRCVAEDLMRQSPGSDSLLYSLLEWRLALTSDPKKPGEYQFERLAREARLDWSLCHVLEHFHANRHVLLCSAWLRGETLPPAALEQLGLNPSEAEQDPEEQALQVVLALCRLVGSGIPLVFCFDQVEALQTTPEDVAGLFRFAQIVSTLHAEAENVLLISAIQSAFLDRFKDAARGADWARVAQHRRGLKALTRAQASKLVEMRLNALPAIAKARPKGENPLWPIREPDLDTLFPQGSCAARRVIERCADLFEEFRGSAAPVPALESFLTNLWKERLQKANGFLTAEQADDVLDHGLRLLIPILKPEWKLAGEAADDIKLSFVFRGADRREHRLGVAFCNHPDGRVLSAQFRRLQTQMTKSGCHSLALLRDPRLPIPAKATATQQYLAELVQQGATLLQATEETLRSFQAIRVVLSDAKSGDLTYGGETVTVAAVETWLKRNLPPALHLFVSSLATQKKKAAAATMV